MGMRMESGSLLVLRAHLRIAALLGLLRLMVKQEHAMQRNYQHYMRRDRAAQSGAAAVAVAAAACIAHAAFANDAARITRPHRSRVRPLPAASCG